VLYTLDRIWLTYTYKEGWEMSVRVYDVYWCQMHGCFVFLVYSACPISVHYQLLPRMFWMIIWTKNVVCFCMRTSCLFYATSEELLTEERKSLNSESSHGRMPTVCVFDHLYEPYDGFLSFWIWQRLH
jgi:hypothetical protein